MQPSSQPPDRPDERLLAAFVAGDPAGFAALVRRYGPELYQFLVRLLRDAAAAEDVVQETFLQVHQSATTFDPVRRFRPWLFTIAVNKARDLMRVRGRRRELPLGGGGSEAGDPLALVDFFSDDVPAPSENVEAEEQRERVREIIGRMPDHLREILVLGYYQRLPYKEIAEILAIPLGTVKSRLHAAVSVFANAYKAEERRTGD